MKRHHERIRVRGFVIQGVLRVLSGAPRTVTVDRCRRFINHLRVQRSSAFPMERSALGHVFRQLHAKRFNVKRFLVAILGAQVAQIVLNRYVQDRVGTPTPCRRLLIAMLNDHLYLIRPLRLTMIFLVRPPQFLRQGPILIRTIRRAVRYLRNALRVKDVHLLRTRSLFYRRLAHPCDFDGTFLYRVGVHPPHRTIFLVPYALTITGRGGLFRVISFRFCL